MVAFNGGRYPLVNPAAFHFGGDSIWLTTSRHAVKVGMARKRPEVSFLVEGGGRCVLLEGEAEVYDPRSVPGIVAGVMGGPGLYLNLAGYAFKNAAFIGGYLRDLARIPGDWWPQNRALLRLRITRTWSLPSVGEHPAGPALVPGVPSAIRRALTRVPVAYACTVVDGVPLMAPALWTSEGGLSLVTGVAGFLGISSRSIGGVAIESHHPYRATRMIGAYLRGRFTPAPDAKQAVADRYEMVEIPPGQGLHLDAERVTWWRGFHLETGSVEAEERAPAAAAAPRRRRLRQASR